MISFQVNARGKRQPQFFVMHHVVGEGRHRAAEGAAAGIQKGDHFDGDGLPRVDEANVLVLHSDDKSHQNRWRCHDSG